MLYKRRKAGHALHSAELLKWTSELVAERAAAEGNGQAELRRVAIQELESGDSETVALSLVFLSVVGQPQDLPKVEPLVAHPSDLIQRAARACRFQLQAMARSHT